MQKPEILAPAGSFDALVAAVRCGADAVYLGSKALNARRGASNFDGAELERAVEYCHQRGAKVYQTLNILLFEEERAEAHRAVETACRIGVDAVLAQDLGIAAIVRECAPGLSLHASTQLAVHNLSGAKLAAEMGFQRVVLARELEKGEIARITAECGIETEVFVHGALCMSVSGQCYLSSMLGERSGNRGLCAQPCRLPFTAPDGRRFALSLKDLTLADRVAELARLGVRSLKIEGRMKRPEYVAAAVTAVRRAIQGEKADFGTLRSVFSRSGFTSGYFDGKRDQSMFGIREKEDVVSAKNVLGELSRLYDRETPLVPVRGELTAEAGKPARLVLADRDGNRAETAGEAPQTALSKPTAPERARESLSKMGGTPFFLEEAQCRIGEGLMLPAAALNALRREAVEQLLSLRGKPRPHAFRADALPKAEGAPVGRKKPKLRARLSAGQLTPELTQRCDELVLPLLEIQAAMERGALTGPEKVIAEIPRFLFTGEDKAADQLRKVRALGVQRALAGNLGAVRLAREAGLAVSGGWSLNLTNALALREAKRIGLSDAELSFELNIRKARELGGILPVGLLAYGFLPLMAFRNCPVKGKSGCGSCGGRGGFLTDRKGVRFSVRCAGGQYSELFNSVALYLADRLDEFQGFDFLTLYFTGETQRECEAAVRAYSGGAAPAFLGERTRGLYYRYVL